jgi:hypothetical protein
VAETMSAYRSMPLKLRAEGYRAFTARHTRLEQSDLRQLAQALSFLSPWTCDNPR